MMFARILRIIKVNCCFMLLLLCVCVFSFNLYIKLNLPTGYNEPLYDEKCHFALYCWSF